jgi:hypothetical protein
VNDELGRCGKKPVAANLLVLERPRKSMKTLSQEDLNPGTAIYGALSSCADGDLGVEMFNVMY